MSTVSLFLKSYSEHLSVSLYCLFKLNQTLFYVKRTPINGVAIFGNFSLPSENYVYFRNNIFESISEFGTKINWIFCVNVFQLKVKMKELKIWRKEAANSTLPFYIRIPMKCVRITVANFRCRWHAIRAANLHTNFPKPFFWHSCSDRMSQLHLVWISWYFRQKLSWKSHSMYPNDLCN